MIRIDEIYNEDCLEGMKRIADRSVDAVVCDLPYGILNRRNREARWDRPIPLVPLWEQYRRIIKPDSPQAVRELQGMGIRVVLLTGDNERTAKAIGKTTRVPAPIVAV